MAAIDMTRSVASPVVRATRSGFERLRDAIDPLVRTVLWAGARRRHPEASVSRERFATSPVRLDGDAAERAREILARRLG